MSTTARQDAGKNQHMDCEISILCREALAGAKCANFHSSILGTNIFTPKESVATEVIEAETFAIKDMYKKLRGELSKVPWRRMICNNQGSPKWTFIMYLVILRRLYTKDRLDKWEIHNDSICSLCKAELETHQHLFFACNMANVIWQRLLHWLSINRCSAGWNEELEWTTLHANRKTIQDEVYRMTLAVAVYYIWQERNYRIFQQRERTIEEITKQIIQEIH
ncbi:uncharacterized protein [Solanum tuberosum]|uniref:uncharacterized protein n=1 Tax=Solanum tuberosum TaxID=4113 RepID=UPI00073A10CD|nr:PREDICTED: uncharacterized protein LOC107062510 [Solanum tuberosum]